MKQNSQTRDTRQQTIKHSFQEKVHNNYKSRDSSCRLYYILKVRRSFVDPTSILSGKFMFKRFGSVYLSAVDTREATLVEKGNRY